MVCNECIAKLDAMKVPYKMRLNPNTGRLAPMVQGRPLIVGDPVDGSSYLEQFKVEFTNQITAQGVNGYCESVDFLGGNFSSTWLPSYWAEVAVSASGELMVVGPDGTLVMFWDDLCVAIFAMIVLPAFWQAVLGIAIIAAIIVIIGMLTAQPQYNFTDQNGNPVKGTWDEYISNQNSKYWFVCGKDGYAVGERSIYVSASDVPQAQITLFNEHCNNAPDLSPPQWWNSLLMQIVYVAVAVGAVYLVIKVVPSLLNTRRS